MLNDFQNDRQSISSEYDGEHNDESMMDVMNKTHRMLWTATAKKVATIVIQPSSTAVEHFFNSKHCMALEITSRICCRNIQNVRIQQS